MLSFELKRIAKNGTGPVCFGISTLLVLSGYLMQTAFYDTVPQNLWLNGLLIAFTQFGAMIIPAISIATVCRDYSEGSIVFYRQLGFNSITYFLANFLSLFLFYLLGATCSLIVGASIYGSFNFIPLMIGYISCLLSFYLTVSLLVGMLVGTFVPAYFSELIVWILLTFFVAQRQELSFLWPFDQNAFLTKSFVNALAGGSVAEFGFNQLLQAFGVSIFSLGIGILVCYFANRRWCSLGIK